MRKGGHITVFLSLILVCIFALMCGLLESARTAGARCYLQTAVHSSLDSVMSQYHRELWDTYRLIFLEYGRQEDISNVFDRYLEGYLDTESWYPMELEKTQVTAVLGALDDRGRYLEKEILDYMKYGIWELDFTAEEADSLWSNLKEAGALKVVSDAYARLTKEALKVEEALEDIDKALEKQMKLYTEAMSCLQDGDGSDFRKKAKALISELKKMSKLVDNYEKKADQLGISIQKTKQEILKEHEDLTDEVRNRIEAEMAHYEEYTAKDGERRQEIRALVPLAENNINLLEEVILEALEVEEVIDDWEGDEDEELDVDALWRSVIRRLSKYQHSSLSFAHGIKDKEKKGWLEEVQKMAEMNLLAIVLPEGAEISKGILDTADFPSENHEFGEGSDGSGLVTNILVNEYCGLFYSNFLTENKKDVQYEMEYLLGGKNTDEGNLTSAIQQVLMVREGFNLLHILSDSEKREEARALASLIVGASGLAPLVMITSFLIMGIWALGEAIMDVRTLLGGGKISLIKNKGNWSLSLDSLLQLGSSGHFDNRDGDEGGLGYESYLKLLLLLKNTEQKYYQMMDVIQMNLKRKQDDFLMEYCAYQVDIKSTVCGKHVFFSIGFVENLTGTEDVRYTLTAGAKKAY